VDRFEMEDLNMGFLEAPEWFDLAFSEEEIDREIDRILPLGVV
jgi:hypothetical protein